MARTVTPTVAPTAQWQPIRHSETTTMASRGALRHRRIRSKRRVTNARWVYRVGLIENSAKRRTSARQLSDCRRSGGFGKPFASTRAARRPSPICRNSSLPGGASCGRSAGQRSGDSAPRRRAEPRRTGTGPPLAHAFKSGLFAAALAACPPNPPPGGAGIDPARLDPLQRSGQRGDGQLSGVVSPNDVTVLPDRSRLVRSPCGPFGDIAASSYPHEHT